MPYDVGVLMTYDAVFGYSLFMLPILWLDSVLNERRVGFEKAECNIVKDRIGLSYRYNNDQISKRQACKRSVYIYQHPE